MARARLLHPEFARHEGLAELSHTHRLLFAMLPTIADREGLLEDRPRRIKADLFPYDSDLDADVENGLVALERVGCIQRIDLYGRKVISIPGFLRWNKPHKREKQSELAKPQAITKIEGTPKADPWPALGSKSPPVSDPVPVTDPVGKDTAAAASAPLTLVPEEPKAAKAKKPDLTPGQDACRRAIRERFMAEWRVRSNGADFDWAPVEHIGIGKLAALDRAGGVNPEKGLRALETFIERMAVKPYYASNFAPRIVAQEINNLRLPVVADGARRAARGPGAAEGARPVPSAEDFDKSEREYQERAKREAGP